MKYRYFGQTGVQVSELCLGTMSFGGDASKDISLSMYKTAREAGINFFDTADHYNHGLSEQYLGEFMEHERKNVIVATKCYFPNGEDINSRGASRKHLFESVHLSLENLGTDYIDLLLIHRFDENTPLEETMRALDDLVRQGKILYYGASNFAAWQVMKAEGIARRAGYARLKCVQLMYNLVKRQAEVELLPMAVSENMGVMSYSPLAAGLLTGKYLENNAPATGRLSSNDIYKKRYGKADYTRTAEKFTRFAEENGWNPASLAVRWAATHKAVTCPIIGARDGIQLKASIDSVKIEMTEELRKRISSLSEEPAPATDRLEEKE